MLPIGGWLVRAVLGAVTALLLAELAFVTLMAVREIAKPRPCQYYGPPKRCPGCGGDGWIYWPLDATLDAEWERCYCNPGPFSRAWAWVVGLAAGGRFLWHRWRSPPADGTQPLQGAFRSSSDRCPNCDGIGCNLCGGCWDA
jgi:hypothetical protein